MKILCAEECAPEKTKPAGNGWTLASGALYIFMPKCAFCWAAYMSLFSSVGLVIRYQPWFVPLAGLLFLATMLKLLVGALRTKNYISFLLALAAAALMIRQQASPGPDAIKILAIGLMTLALTGKKLRRLFHEITQARAPLT